MENNINYIGCFTYGDPSINFDYFLESNPGIGGTEYLYLCLSLLLARTNKYKVVLFSPKLFKYLPKDIIQLQCTNSRDAIKYFNDHYGGIFIYTPKCDRDSNLSCLNKTQIILWNHLELSKKILRQCNETSNVVANVVLSESQAKWMYNSKMFSKTTVIYNFVSHINRDRNADKSLNVYYVGAMFPSKNVDCLTSVWPRIVKRVPNAKLFIVGSSKVYNPDAKVGELGISSPEYEKIIIGPLKKHNVLNSVSFLGKLSNDEIYNELEHCNVGVVNPVGTGETFCISALNFGIMGIPVVSGDYGGLKTTVPKGCGFRVKSKNKLVKCIVKLLLDDELNSRFGNNYRNVVINNFSREIFEKKWIDLIDSIIENGKCKNTFVFSRIKCFISSLGDKVYISLRRVNSFLSRRKWRR